MTSLDNPFRSTPFRDTAVAISKKRDYVQMSVDCDRARSHAWWKNLVDYGAWGGTSGRVGPPDREALPGIAKLFGTTEEQVATMIAADWYGVTPEKKPSALVVRLTPYLDGLAPVDEVCVETLVQRLHELREYEDSKER